MVDFLGHHIIFSEEPDFPPIVFFNVSQPFMRLGTNISTNAKDYSTTPSCWQLTGQAPDTASDF